MSQQDAHNPQEAFYQNMTPRLYRRIGKELRLAGRILDLGCGACELVCYLAKTFRQQVTGVDISAGSFPRRRHTPNGCRFRCIRKNAKHLHFVKDESMDAVVSTLAFHEMEHPEAILHEVRRILRPGGELLIVDFPKDSLAQELWNEDYYTPEALKQMVADNGFDEVRAKTIERGQVMWITGRRSPNPGEKT
ncbi:MAG: class I SAM-dependent methyltransferase [Phycisphaerae bacterium]|nr:class I SAM-dependent methyltransferase [Phycisphaerae bacterium]